MTKIACIIPARLNSTRFPRKILAKLKGQPLLQWVWEAAQKVSLFDTVAIAVDAQETADVVRDFGGSYFFTSPNCPSGTDRLIEVMEQGDVTADIWVNWQGDEPFINAAMIQDLLQNTEKSDIWTLCKKIEKEEQIKSPHVVKVVRDAQGYALYFSRSQIPYIRDSHVKPLFYKHIGLYAYTQAALKQIKTLKPCYLEEAEQLEQLRFLYNGLSIRVHETQFEALGIDLPEHLAQAEAFLNRQF